MRIAVCDDEQNELEIMQNLFNNYPQAMAEWQIVYFTAGKELLEDKTGFDIIFLDIELTDSNGVEVAAKIKIAYPLSQIIFISNYPKYVTQSYYIDTFQFLIKPLTQEIFDCELTRCLEKVKRGAKIIIRKAKEGKVTLKKADIVYLEAQRRVLTVYLRDGSSYQYYGRLADEAEELGNEEFVRCHKSFIVNLEFVLSFDYKNIVLSLKADGSKNSTLSGNISIPIGGAYYKNFKEEMLKFLAF